MDTLSPVTIKRSARPSRARYGLSSPPGSQQYRMVFSSRLALRVSTTWGGVRRLVET
jgi:hypothetical protein